MESNVKMAVGALLGGAILAVIAIILQPQYNNRLTALIFILGLILTLIGASAIWTCIREWLLSSKYFRSKFDAVPHTVPAIIQAQMKIIIPLWDIHQTFRTQFYIMLVGIPAFCCLLGVQSITLSMITLSPWQIILFPILLGFLILVSLQIVRIMVHQYKVIGAGRILQQVKTANKHYEFSRGITLYLERLADNLLVSTWFILGKSKELRPLEKLEASWYQTINLTPFTWIGLYWFFQLAWEALIHYPLPLFFIIPYLFFWGSSVLSILFGSYYAFKWAVMGLRWAKAFRGVEEWATDIAGIDNSHEIEGKMS